MEKENEFVIKASDGEFLAYLFDHAEYQDVVLNLINTILCHSLDSKLIRISKKLPIEKDISIWNRNRKFEFVCCDSENKIINIGIRPYNKFDNSGTIIRDGLSLYLFQNCDKIEIEQYKQAIFIQFNENEGFNKERQIVQEFSLNSKKDGNCLSSDMKIILFNLNKNLNITVNSEELNEWYKFFTDIRYDGQIHKTEFKHDHIKKCCMIFEAFCQNEEIIKGCIAKKAENKMQISAREYVDDYDLISSLNYDLVLGGSGLRRNFYEFLRRIQKNQYSPLETCELAELPLELILKIGR